MCIGHQPRMNRFEGTPFHKSSVVSFEFYLSLKHQNELFLVVDGMFRAKFRDEISTKMKVNNGRAIRQNHLILLDFLTDGTGENVDVFLVACASVGLPQQQSHCRWALCRDNFQIPSHACAKPPYYQFVIICLDDNIGIMVMAMAPRFTAILPTDHHSAIISHFN